MYSPFISWQDWESHVLDFFRFALLELTNAPDLPHLEADKAKDNLNRRLEVICRTKIAIWIKNGGIPAVAPTFRGRNQARPGDKQPQESEQKEPDAQVYQFIDYEKGISHCYTIECKRLDLTKDGSPHGKSQYYVNDGILRFIKGEYGYGNDVVSGLMIGYVQSSDFDKFHQCVNHYCKKANVSNLTLLGEWTVKGVSELEQPLFRTEMKPQDFQLRHFWVDLR